MLIWTGWGILVLPITFAAVGVGAFLGAAIGSPTIGVAIGLLGAGPAIWFAGQRLNREEEGFHPKTGEPVVYRNRNKLFFIPMQYFAFIVPVIAIYVVALAVMTPA